MGALGEPRQPGGVLRVERDIQPKARSLHVNECTRTSTKRVPISQQVRRRDLADLPQTCACRHAADPVPLDHAAIVTRSPITTRRQEPTTPSTALDQVTKVSLTLMPTRDNMH